MHLLSLLSPLHGFVVAPKVGANIYVSIGELSNIIAFLLIHIAQQRAATPVSKYFLILWTMLFDQSLKRCITDKDISILKNICIVVRMNLTK
jgi:hypothetical protein